MTAKERDKEIKHWESVIEKCEKECCKYVRLCGTGVDNSFYSKKCSDLKQEIYYAEHRIEQVREQWRLSKVQNHA